MSAWIPRIYQERALKLMLGQACVGLFLDPGLGKTAITLAAFKVLKNEGLVKSMLVIAPLRVCYSVWPNEIQKWDNFEELTISVLHGKDKVAALEQEADIYVINPEGLKWLIDGKHINKMTCDVLCVDESTRFKHTKTARFKLLKKILGRFARRWILTGTPAPNGLIDLFGQMFILDEGGSLGRYITHYRNKYFYQSGFGGYTYTPMEDSMERITDKIDPYVLRLKAEDWVEMPELINQTILVQLPPEAREKYNELEEHFITMVADQPVTAPNAAACGVRLRQMCNGAIYGSPVDYRIEKREIHQLHTAKLDALEELVEELSGQPILVAYEFDHDRQLIQERLKDTPAIGGGTSPADSAAMLENFRQGLTPVLLAHPQSAGHGLDGMQEACNHICWYGLTWNLEFYEQLMHRVYRSGQKKATVFQHFIIAENTLDNAVIRTLNKKDRTQSDLFANLRRPC